MSKNQAVSRSAKSSSITLRVKLSQIRTDSMSQYCHRFADAFKAENLSELADSLVAEGQQTPLTVYDSGAQEDGLTIYTLIGGFRRYNALRKAIKENLDTARIHNDINIDVVEIVRGDDQTKAEFYQDVLVRSVSENEQRRSTTTAEKLDIAKAYTAAEVPEPRAALSLRISETQYRRFVSVVENEWLHKYVTQDCIGMSHAAELIQAATKKNRVQEFKEDFDAWVSDQRTLIEEERKKLAKVGKKLSGFAAQVKSQLRNKLVQHWLQCIEAERRFDDDVDLRFGIHVDANKGMIYMPNTELKVNELSSADFELMIAELEETVRQFIPLMRKCRMAEQVTDISEDDIERERERIRDRYRERQEQEAAEEAGRPAPSFHQTEDSITEPVNTDEEGEDPNHSTEADRDAETQQIPEEPKG